MTTTATIGTIVDDGIGKMFENLVAEYDLPYGDIAPEQLDQLDRLKQDLADLLGDFVYNNLPAEKELQP